MRQVAVASWARRRAAGAVPRVGRQPIGELLDGYEAECFVTIELKLLALSVGLGFVQIVAASHSASLQRGYRWSAGSRDEPVKPLQGIAGRLDRALRNFLETFPLFAAVVLTANALGRHNALTEWGARLYFWGRVAYLPLYAAGVPLVRSLAWNVAAVGILLFLVALLWN